MNHVRFHGAMRPGRAHRTQDNAYRRRPRKPIAWGAVLDAMCWAVGVLFFGAIGVWALVRTVQGLNSLWQ